MNFMHMHASFIAVILLQHYCVFIGPILHYALSSLSTRTVSIHLGMSRSTQQILSRMCGCIHIIF